MPTRNTIAFSTMILGENIRYVNRVGTARVWRLRTWLLTAKLKSTLQKVGDGIDMGRLHRESKSLTELHKEWKKPKVDENLVLMNMVKMKMNKPTMSGIVINLNTGRIRKPKVGEVGLLIIDHSDPTLADGDLVIPKRSCMKHDKKK